MSRITRLQPHLAAIIATCLAVYAAPAVAVPLSGLYVFGDSLVDSGNARKAAQTFDIFLPGIDDPAPPSKGYYQGRFANGYNYADFLSLAITGQPSKTVFPYGFPVPIFGQIRFDKPKGNNMNFAYGGAQGIRGKEDVPGFNGQYEAYKDLPGGADPNALYLINFGGNDLFSLINSGASPAKTTAQLRDVAARIASRIAGLEAIGAQHFLVTGAPDIGLVPRYNALADPIEAETRARGTAASFLLDSLVQSELAKLELASSFTADLMFFSYLDFIDDVFSHPELYGLPQLNFRDTCLAFRTPGANGRVDCTGFAFFDELHPTTEVHYALYQAMRGLVFPSVQSLTALAVAQVPEPAPLALLGGGMFILALRRRRKRQLQATGEVSSITAGTA